MLKLFEKYIDGIDNILEDSVMSVPVKFREQLCFKGKKVDYSDVTKFVLRNGTYTPIMFVPDINENDKIINMFPLICVGISELLATPCCVNDLTFLQFEMALYEDNNMYKDLDCYKNFRNFIDINNEKVDRNSDEITIVLSLRTDYISCGFESIKRLTSALVACYFTNPKFFCEILLESMKFAYTICSLYTSTPDKLAGFSTYNGCISSFNVKSMLPISATNPKKIGYTTPDTKKRHYISNCRGLGIYSYLILLFKIYEHFGVCNTSHVADIGVKSQKYHDLLQERFVNCLGDDYIGRYYTLGKVVKFRPDCEDLTPSIICQAALAPNSGVVYTLSDGTRVARDIYENNILFKRANRVNFTKVTDGNYIRNTNVYYTNTFSIEGIFSSSTKLSSAIKDLIQNKSTINLSNYIEKSEHDSIIHKVKTQTTDAIAILQDKHSVEIEGYKKKIEELNAILSSKSGIIENLSDELRVNREKLNSYYSDEDISIDTVEHSVSLEEAVSYINQFSTTMVGGRFDIISKLNKLGWTNVSQVDDSNMLNNTPASSDFFCFNTRFISHRAVRSIESAYSNQKSQMYYYNGTNIENLVFCTYNFIKRWVEG